MLCCVKKPPCCIPYTHEIKTAANLKSTEYGGIKPITVNIMRYNYMQRLNDILNTPDIFVCPGAGGANYVNVQYDNNLNYKIQNPYATGGFRKYQDAYNSEQCVQSFDEY